MAYTPFEQFKFHIQKVFPAIYDDTLSYYELLSKVISQLNKIGEETILTQKEVNAILEWVKGPAFYDYVTKAMQEIVDNGTFERIVNEVALANLSKKANAAMSEILNTRSFKDDKFPVFVSHNGLNYIAPINTLPAYDLAGQGGYKYFEVDVRTSADGVWYAFHDDFVDTMTDGTGEFKLKTSDEISQLNIDTKPTTYPGTKVPTFEEFLKVCTKWKATPVIEIKVYQLASDIENLLKIISDYGYRHKCIIMSLGTFPLETIRKIDEEIALCLLSNTASVGDIEDAISVQADYVSINKSAVNKGFCSTAHSYNIKVGAWTSDNEDEITRLLDMGVDVITTNSILPRGV